MDPREVKGDERIPNVLDCSCFTELEFASRSPSRSAPDERTELAFAYWPLDGNVNIPNYG